MFRWRSLGTRNRDGTRWCWAARRWALTGVYYAEGRIVFNDRPVEEWEFMATGTGVTGLTVNFPDEMVVQVNHSTAIDEGGKLRALGRLHLDLAGRPFANAGQFRMEHDLRKSVITAIAETSEGPVKVEIRAHVPDDVIRIDIHDGRRTPGVMTIRLEEDASAAVNSDETCGVCFWHENPADAVAPDKPENSGTGADIPGDNRGWLAGRVFGLAVKGEGESHLISDRTLTFPARARHSLHIAGVSTLGGKDRFIREARERQNKAVREGGKAFLRTHEAWWNDFWQRSRLVIHDPTGRMLKYQASFDLYRYYLACCAGERRETPPRFQIDLYRYHLRQHGWLTGIICAVEQYQSYYGAIRTGDWGALRGLASFYARSCPTTATSRGAPTALAVPASRCGRAPQCSCHPPARRRNSRLSGSGSNPTTARTPLARSGCCRSSATTCRSPATRTSLTASFHLWRPI